MASPGISQTITATLQQLSTDISDEILNNNLIFKKIKNEKVSGGRYLSHPIFYAENDSFQWYSGWETLSTQTNEILTSAEYAWKQASINVQMSGLEEIQNAGKEKLIGLLTSKIENQRSTMQNKMALALYSDGTGNGGKEIGGLQLIVADVNTNTVGGISGSTWSFWRNYSYDATTDGGAAVTSVNIQGYMDNVKIAITNHSGGQEIDIIAADNNYYRAYKQSLQAIQRITTGKASNLGDDGIMFDGIPVHLDGGKGGACPTNHMYFLNFDHLMLQTSSQRDFTAVGGERTPLNQDGSITYTFWAGNLTCGSRQYQAVLKD